MKPKFRLFLFPLSIIYYIISSVRNFLFNVNIFKNFQPPLFTVNVGNIQVGGTGKTPHVAYLLELFKSNNRTILSRGYGRKAKGLLWATPNSTANEIGDEPLQLYKSYTIDLVVSENRLKGIHEIIQKGKTEIILLDDAFQHRFVTPHLNLLLTTYDEPFFDDCILPVGNLREAKSGLKRADALIITKCKKDLDNSEKNFFLNKMSIKCNISIPVFFSFINYKKPKGFLSNDFKIDIETVVISGIAKPSYFIEYCKENYNCKEILSYNDHHFFTENEILEIVKRNGKIQYITTEKDFVKIEELLSEEYKNMFYYLPIEVDFFDKLAFNDFILMRFDLFNNRLKNKNS